MSPSVLYCIAAAVWLVLGFASGNFMYLVLSAVFFLLGFQKRKKKDD